MPTQYTRKIKRPVIFVIGPSIAYVPLTQGLFSVIESGDAAMIGVHNWSAAWKPKGKAFYALAHIDGKMQKMHRLILNCSDEEIGDHKNRQTLDNRRSNLRSVDATLSNRNRSFKRDGGIVGVNFLTGKWRAQIGVGGAMILLGNFATQEEAANARLAAEIKHGYPIRQNAAVPVPA